MTADLAALLAAATPGPWRYRLTPQEEGFVVSQHVATRTSA